jgi:hypothetical protein
MTAHNAPKTVCRYLTLRSLQTKTNIQLPVEPQLGQPQLPPPVTRPDLDDGSRSSGRGPASGGKPVLNCIPTFVFWPRPACAAVHPMPSIEDGDGRQASTCARTIATWIARDPVLTSRAFHQYTYGLHLYSP